MEKERIERLTVEPLFALDERKGKEREGKERPFKYSSTNVKRNKK